MKYFLRCAALLVATSVTASAAADPVPPHYAVQLLSHVGPQTFPLALNNNLQFATYYSFDHPIPAWAEDHFVDFNDKAERLGWSYRDCCDYVNRQYYLYTGGSQVWLGGLREGNAINNHSVIAGSYNSASGAQHAVLYDGSNYKDLGTLGGPSSSASDVNNNGEAIGWSETGNGETHPFLYTGGAMQDLSALPGWVGSPDAINDRGQMVVSYRDESFNNHVLFYSDGVFQEIVAPGPRFFFTDLNNLGQVLLYRPEAPAEEGSILWQDGHSYELLSLVDPSAHYRYGPAVDINDNGQLLIRGCSLSNRDDCSVLMLQPVPEPQSWLMLLAGLAWLARPLFRRSGECRTVPGPAGRQWHS